MIKMIAAVSKNGIIGVDNKIPWDYPEDMKFFRKMTADSVVVMGRKTFESIGRPLPKRRNIVVSRIAKGLGTLKNVENIEVASSVRQAIDMCEGETRNIWLIGGESVYTDGLEFADEIYITEIPKVVDTEHKQFARFPYISTSLFMCDQNNYYEKLTDALNVVLYTKVR